MRYAIVDLGAPKGSFSLAHAIDNSGQVVGLCGYYAFLYSKGVMRKLGSLGGKESEAFAINNRGQVAGRAQTAAGPNHAFLYSDGKMRDLGTLGGPTSAAYGINDAGQIVGESQIAGDGRSPRHAFLYSGGKMVDLGVLRNGEDSSAKSINAGGRIVGSATTGFRPPRPFVTAILWSHGKMTDLGVAAPWQYDICDDELARDHPVHRPAEIQTWDALGINASGEVVGTAFTRMGERAFVISRGTMVDLGTIGGTWGESSHAAAMNGFGQVIGVSNTAAGGANSAQPFLYMHGAMYDLNALREPSAEGWANLMPAAINDAGQIAGQATNRNFGMLTRAVLLMPVKGAVASK